MEWLRFCCVYTKHCDMIGHSLDPGACATRRWRCSSSPARACSARSACDMTPPRAASRYRLSITHRYVPLPLCTTAPLSPALFSCGWYPTSVHALCIAELTSIRMRNAVRSLPTPPHPTKRCILALGAFTPDLKACLYWVYEILNAFIQVGDYLGRPHGPALSAEPGPKACPPPPPTLHSPSTSCLAPCSAWLRAFICCVGVDDTRSLMIA